MAQQAEVHLYLVHSTENAYQFSTGDNADNKAKFWIPRSLIDYIRKDPIQEGHWQHCFLKLPTWKAEELNLEDES